MKLDLHVHSWHSKHAVSSEETIIKAAKKLGIGIAISDHNTCKAWPKIREAGKKHGVPVIFGEEIKIFEGNSFQGELLGLFMQESATEQQKNGLWETVDKLKKQDALLVLPHPFDLFRGKFFAPFKKLDEVKGKIDAVEVFNSRMYCNCFNKQAEKFASENRLGRTAGSDAHFPEEIGNAAIEFKGNTLEEARKEIKAGTGIVKGRIAPKRVHFYTQLAKFHLLKVR